MTKFELFCMIYYVLDACYDQNKNDILRQFLSDANPFLFEDSGSADPAVFEEFCSIVDEPIDNMNSYAVAKKYLKLLNIPELYDSFLSISEADWQEGLDSFLSNPHKE